MKKFSLLFISSFLATISFSQTLFTYGTQAVSKEEFLRAYNKNKTAESNKKAALREYLQLYIKFKLKVKAALDMRLDTLPNINADLQSFRSQVEESYLSDEKEVNLLVQEAFTRSHKDIHIVHLFIPGGKSAEPSDTLISYTAAQEAWKALTEKNSAFSDVTAGLGKKSIAATWADIGFITVFGVPYEFENIVYNLKPGQVSKPYRTKNGYHIFKDIEERPAAGKIKAAQVLIAIPPGGSDEQRNRALKIADSAYKALKGGADFSEMAKAISDDKMTFANGGEMPQFGTGKYDPAFESKAFSLQHDGEITTPFQTSFGYHILKRLSRTPVTTDKTNADYLALLKQQVQQDVRILLAKEKLLKDVLKTLGYKKNNSLNEDQLWRITDSFVVSDKNPDAVKLKNTFLYSFNNAKILVGDWFNFVRTFKKDPNQYRGESYPEIMKKYLSNTAFEKYRQKLEDYNADFKYQVEEFKAGNMLFEIMERNVWSKASNDSSGLLRFYNQHKNKYYWKESADAVLISCANDNIARIAAGEIRNGKSWKQVTEESSSKVQTDSGRYELSQIPVKDKGKLTDGAITDPISNDADSTASFVKIIHIYPASQPRSFEESRGLVINDYQDFIEEKWIAELKKRYPVKINETVFQTLLR